MDRRRFVKLCGGTAVLAGLQANYAEIVRAAEPRMYKRVKLVDDDGNPLKAARLSLEEAYVFNYPFKATPAFLIRLPAAADTITLKADDGEYAWRGGVGPGGALVAYIAICPHQLSYPTREHTPIAYSGSVAGKTAGKPAMIVCCEHGRVYDPSLGGQMVARNKKDTPPLAAILIEHDAVSDEIHATGVAGAPVFDEFFRAYKKPLIDEYGPGVAREEVADTAVATLLSKYSQAARSC